jgi:hypothetical protein
MKSAAESTTHQIDPNGVVLVHFECQFELSAHPIRPCHQVRIACKIAHHRRTFIRDSQELRPWISWVGLADVQKRKFSVVRDCVSKFSFTSIFLVVFT